MRILALREFRDVVDVLEHAPADDERRKLVGDSIPAYVHALALAEERGLITAEEAERRYHAFLKEKSRKPDR